MSRPWSLSCSNSERGSISLAPSIKTRSYGARGRKPCASVPVTTSTLPASIAFRFSLAAAARTASSSSAMTEPASSCEERGRIPGCAAYIEHVICCAHAGRLHHLCEHHRLEQAAPCAGSGSTQWNVTVEISESCVRSRHEALAGKLQHGGNDAQIGDITRAHLAVHHAAACGGEIGHEQGPDWNARASASHTQWGKASRYCRSGCPRISRYCFGLAAAPEDLMDCQGSVDTFVVGAVLLVTSL